MEERAREIADDLLRLKKDGALRGEEDPQFYATLMVTFGARYTGSNKPRDELDVDWG